jgi:large subunit ribosomal protein L31
MKASIHPKYNQASVSCSCGNMFTVGSTKDKINVEICHKCHPLFTGETRFVDTKGQVEKFNAKREFAKKYVAKDSKNAKSNRPENSRSLKDLLSVAQ